jgi:hypothetical protein
MSSPDPHAPGTPEALPDVEDRDGKWSPLGVGLLSIVFDPMLIVSVVAVRRALSDLTRVRAHESLGHWSPAHARVRNHAVWGLVLGLGRPLFVVAMLVAVCAGAGTESPRYDGDLERPLPFRPTELDEILSQLASPDVIDGDVAVSHLWGIPLDADGALRVLEAVRGRVAHGLRASDMATIRRPATARGSSTPP